MKKYIQLELPFETQTENGKNKRTSKQNLPDFIDYYRRRLHLPKRNHRNNY